MDTYSMLAPYIREYIYKNKWFELRDIQVAACDLVFKSEDNILLTSGTASGKTEAAFLPALTCLYNNPSDSVGILYISPLKSLINDQFYRLKDLLESAGITVSKWHGDVDVNKKNALIKKPQGVLQITPESLQAMILNHKDYIDRLFCDLRFVIIDEVHYFMSCDRGLQLLCILEQIQAITNNIAPRIGLSATLNNYSEAENWINSGTCKKCITPSVISEKRKLRLSIEYFDYCKDDSKQKDEIPEIKKMYHYLYKNSLGKKTLIFANSREEVEKTIAKLKMIASEYKTPDLYRVHHGNISATIREDIEKELKESEVPIVTGATLTLELGIDIGALDRIIQLESPVTASSFVQRLGRCGRRGNPSEMMFVFKHEDDNQKKDDVIDKVDWEFLKCIAIIQLYLEEKWIEPNSVSKFPCSLLYHQTLSVLYQYGEISAALLAQKILKMTPFQNFTIEDYKLLLTHLLEIGHIEKIENGHLVIGKKAERIVSNYNFYSVFESGVDYSVLYKSRLIGTITIPYPVGAKFLLSGQAWLVQDINKDAKSIYVLPVKGVSDSKWLGDSKANIHTKIIRKMKNILECDHDYMYLSNNSKRKLQLFRDIIRKAGILNESIVTLENLKRQYIYPWLGTNQLITLHHILQAHGIDNSIVNMLCIEVPLRDNIGIKAILEEIVCNNAEYSFTLSSSEIVRGKYIKYVPTELRDKQYLADIIDVDGVKEGLKDIL